MVSKLCLPISSALMFSGAGGMVSPTEAAAVSGSFLKASASSVLDRFRFIQIRPHRPEQALSLLCPISIFTDFGATHCTKIYRPPCCRIRRNDASTHQLTYIDICHFDF